MIFVSSSYIVIFFPATLSPFGESMSQLLQVDSMNRLVAMHNPQNCPTHTPQRTRLWPSGADFRDKLWGSKEELRTTAQFIKNIHLQIWHDHYQHLYAEEEEYIHTFTTQPDCSGFKCSGCSAFIYVLCIHLIIPFEKLGPPNLGTATAAARTALSKSYHFLLGLFVFP